MKGRILKWIGNLFTTLLLIFVVIMLISLLQSKNNPEQIPSLFGYKVMTVLSGSMEPSLEPGDLIVVKADDTKQPEVGDVITYRKDGSTLVTHRIVESAGVNFITKGDANNVKDQGVVTSDQIVGSLQFHVPKLGYLINFMKSPFGLTLLILISMIILTIGIAKGSLHNKHKESDLKV